MENITTLQQAQDLLAAWKEHARISPLRGPGAAVRGRVRNLEVLISIVVKRSQEAQRSVSDLQDWLDAQGSEVEEAANCGD